MWNWFNCYLSGRHDYGVWCQPGAIYLRCVHCGKRSSGWTVTEKGGTPAPRPLAAALATAPPATHLAHVPVAAARPHGSRVLPFTRAVVR